MSETEVDLAALFNTVARTLKENQATLNGADEYNHNHGSNMVKNFKVISKAMKQKQDAPPSEQLAYAGQVLQRSSTSGSAKLYSEGLTRAAAQLQGQPAVDEKNALSLIQALMGGQQTSQQAAQPPQDASSDLMGGLMGALLGGASSSQGSQQQSQAASGDMMGGLMGALLGGASGTQGAQQTQSGSGDMMGDLMGSLLGGAAGGTSQTAQSGQGEGGINLGSLLNAGMAFFQAQQQGASTVEALISAVMAGSQMNSTPHQSQSGQLVAGTLLNALGSMLGGKK